MPQTDVEIIYSPDRGRRVTIFRRADGTFGFFEEYYSQDRFEDCWIPLFNRHTESYCDSLETVRREVYGRVAWLAQPD